MANVYQSQYSKIAIRALNADTASYFSGSVAAALEILDEGSTLTTSVSSIDFVGAGVTASNVGSAVTVTIPGGSGGPGTPGGSDTQIQFNSASVFSGSGNLRFDYVTNTIHLTGSISASSGANTVSFYGTASWAQSASYALTASYIVGVITSSYPIDLTGSTLFSRGPAAGVPSMPTSDNSIFLGLSAGGTATNASSSNFLGKSAGSQATNASFSNFIGNSPGLSAINANNSNFLGFSAGQSATNASQSNFLGRTAGTAATNAAFSNFLGLEAGNSSTYANNSNFIGNGAGALSTNASHSNFLGYRAGRSAINAPFSTLIGYQVGYNSNFLSETSIGSNNIILGTNITLPYSASDSINLGGIIFATGSYSTITGTPFSGSAAGKVGINIYPPSYNLHVSGTVGFPNLTDSNTATKVVLLDNNGQLFTTASNAIGGGGSGGNFVPSSWTGSNASVFAGTASYVTGSIFTSTNPALSASYAQTASTIILNPILPTTLYIVGSTSTGGGEKTLTNNAFSYTTATKLINATASWAESASQALTASFWGGYSSTSSVIGNGLSSSFNINHGFNTRNLHITVYESGSNGETVYPDIRRINANTASIIFANPPSASQYIVYISQ